MQTWLKNWEAKVLEGKGGIILSASALSFIVSSTIWSLLTRQETEAQRKQVTGPKPHTHSWGVPEPVPLTPNLVFLPPLLCAFSSLSEEQKNCSHVVSQTAQLNRAENPYLASCREVEEARIMPDNEWPTPQQHGLQSKCGLLGRQPNWACI